ncbi:hypothetical protein D3C85_967840 [compost metagenome]
MDHLEPLIRRHPLEGPIPGDAGVVDQHVHPALLLQQAAQGLAAHGGVGHIQRQQPHPIRLIPLLLVPLPCSGGIDAGVGGDDAIPLGQQGGGDGGSDAAPGSGDQGNLLHGCTPCNLARMRAR